MRETPTKTSEDTSSAKSAGNSQDESTTEQTFQHRIHSGSRTIKGRNEIMKLLLQKFKEPKKQ
jgi:hypothetical protein